MLGFWPYQRSGLLKPLARGRAGSSRVRDAKDKYKLPLSILLLVVVVLWIAQPVNYDTPQGKLTLHATVGKGKTMFMLGPAGTWEFETQKTPIVLRVDLVLNNDYSGNREFWEIFKPIYDLYKSDTASRVLYEFVTYKVLLLLLLGSLVGFIHSNGGKHWKRNMAWNVFDGVLMMALVVTVVGMTTEATIDRSPKMSATGYASEASPLKLLSAAKELGGNFQIPNGYIRNQLHGVDVVSGQRAYNGLSASSSVFYLMVIADLHGNRRGLEIAEEQFLSGDPQAFAAVLLPGDMVHYGTGEEAKAAFKSWPISGVPVFFDGGNHENAGAMYQLEALGYTKLTSQPVEISGLSVIGADDPLAYSFAMESNKQLLEQASEKLAEQWLACEPRPSLVMVHDLAQAEAVIEAANKEGQKLTVVYGHHHELSIETADGVVMVQGGSGGASGFEAKSREPNKPYTYQILEFEDQPEPNLVAVYSYSYNDETDAFTFTRTPID